MSSKRVRLSGDITTIPKPIYSAVVGEEDDDDECYIEKTKSPLKTHFEDEPQKKSFFVINWKLLPLKMLLLLMYGG